MTRRRIRKLHREAQRWWKNGTWWDSATVPAPPEGPLRIAFECGRKAKAERELSGEPARDLPLDVWTAVLADWLRRDRLGYY